ncbi:MAG: two-component system NarL family sensor kinase [bacterium]|jgi:two-component system NarL family sensor kinase
MEKWQNPQTIIIWIVIAIVFFLLLLGFIVLLIRSISQKIVKTKLAESKAKLEHQQTLLEITIKTQEKERKRIAADLHDDLIGKLIVIKLQQELKPNPNLESIDLMSESIDTARRISHDLSPPLIEHSSLPDLIKGVFDPWKNKIRIVYFFDIRKNNCDYRGSFKIQLLRIIQELTTNIEKHAKANEIIVHFRQSHHYTSIKISDNGIGYNTLNKQKGLGLKNIETRVQYLKGSFRTKSFVGKGTSSLFLFKNSLK